MTSRIDQVLYTARTRTTFLLGARLTVHAAGMDRDVATALAHDAHQTCPYSKAPRGNIDVAIDVLSTPAR